MNTRSQISFEYLIVFAFAVIIMLPLLYAFQAYTTQTSAEIVNNQATRIGQDIATYAATAYYMGNGARLTLDEVMPEGVSSLHLISNWNVPYNEISFNMSDGGTLAFRSDVNINASFTKEDCSPGQKHILLEARNTTTMSYVFIDIS